MSSRAHRYGFALVALTLLAAARAIDAGLVAGPPCALRLATGIPCLTCGMTTAFVHVTRLDLHGAFRSSPLGAALALACIAWPPLALSRFELPPRAWLWLPRVLVVAAVASWVFVLASQPAGRPCLLLCK